MTEFAEEKIAELGEGVALVAMRGLISDHRTDLQMETKHQLTVDKGAGGRAYSEVKTTEATTQTIFFNAGGDGERVVRIKNTPAVCRAGHLVLAYVARGSNKELGLQVVNLTTGENVENLRQGLQEVRGSGALADIGRLSLAWVPIVVLIACVGVFAYAEPYDRSFDDLGGALVLFGILAAFVGLSGAAAHSSWRWQWKVQQLIEPHLARFAKRS